MTGQLLFRKNIGTMGAAIQLFSSFLILHEPLISIFLNNSALLYGGAIYADNVVIPGHHRCVIQINTNKTDLHNINIILKFKGNIAGLAGNNIYATPHTTVPFFIVGFGNWIHHIQSLLNQNLKQNSKLFCPSPG